MRTSTRNALRKLVYTLPWVAIPTLIFGAAIAGNPFPLQTPVLLVGPTGSVPDAGLTVTPQLLLIGASGASGGSTQALSVQTASGTQVLGVDLLHSTVNALAFTVSGPLYAGSLTVDGGFPAGATGATGTAGATGPAGPQIEPPIVFDGGALPTSGDGIGLSCDGLTSGHCQSITSHSTGVNSGEGLRVHMYVGPTGGAGNIAIESTWDGDAGTGNPYTYGEYANVIVNGGYSNVALSCNAANGTTVNDCIQLNHGRVYALPGGNASFDMSQSSGAFALSTGAVTEACAATTTTCLAQTANSLTSGTGNSIASSSITNGIGESITFTGTQQTSPWGLYVTQSGGTSAGTSVGVYSTLSNAGTENDAIKLSASGATTNNAISIAAGNISEGAAATWQTTTGNLTLKAASAIALQSGAGAVSSLSCDTSQQCTFAPATGAGTGLTITPQVNDLTGGKVVSITDTSVAHTSPTGLYVSMSGAHINQVTTTGITSSVTDTGTTDVALTLTASGATMNTAINSTAGDWSQTDAYQTAGTALSQTLAGLTSGTGHSIAANALTSGTLASFSTTSTAQSGDKGLYVSLSGTMAADGVTNTAATISNTNADHGGGTSVNNALTLTASGGGSNKAINSTAGDWSMASTLTGVGEAGVSIHPTFNNASNTFTGLLVNATTTAQSASSKALDVQLNGGSYLNVSSYSGTTQLRTMISNNLYFDQNAQAIQGQGASSKIAITGAYATPFGGGAAGGEFDAYGPTATTYGGHARILTGTANPNVVAADWDTTQNLTLTPNTTSGTGVTVNTAATSGDGMDINPNALTSGFGLTITTNSSALTGGSRLLYLDNIGTDSSSGAEYSLFARARATNSGGTNYAGYFSASGATTNHAIYIAAGDVNMLGASSMSVPSISCAAGIKTDSSGVISCAVSDARVKNIEGPVQTGIDELMQLSPKLWRFKPSSGFDPIEQQEGFIAQEVLPIIPQAVHMGGNGLYQVVTMPLVAATVSAVQEVEQQVLDCRADVSDLSDELARERAEMSGLQAEVLTLRAANDSLERRVARLEALLEHGQPANDNARGAMLQRMR